MRNITAEALKERLAKGDKINLVDVREPAEHEEFNIGGLLVPLGRIRQMQADELDEFKDQEVICYCRSGNRSGQACQVLEMMGFTDTVNLTGGMLAWESGR